MNADKKVIARQLKAYFFYKQKPDGYVVGFLLYLHLQNRHIDLFFRHFTK